MIALAVGVTAGLFALGAGLLALYARGVPEAWALYRSEVAIVAAALLPAALHPAAFAAVLAAAASRWSWEVLRLYRRDPGRPALVLCLAAGPAAATAGYLAESGWFVAATACVIGVTWRPVAAAAAGRPYRLSAAATALAFPLLGGAHLAHLAARDDGFGWIFLLFAVVEVQDAMAWLFGRLFGRRPILPTLSPRKTFEGALAGLVAGIAVGVLVARAMLGLSWPFACVLALLITAAGFAGDLFASLLKRAAGAKDFDRVHPLHGGLLDIYDSFLFAAVPLNAALWAASFVPDIFS